MTQEKFASMIFRWICYFAIDFVCYTFCYQSDQSIWLCTAQGSDIRLCFNSLIYEEVERSEKVVRKRLKRAKVPVPK